MPSLFGNNPELNSYKSSLLVRMPVFDLRGFSVVFFCLAATAVVMGHRRWVGLFGRESSSEESTHATRPSMPEEILDLL